MHDSTQKNTTPRKTSPRQLPTVIFTNHFILFATNNKLNLKCLNVGIAYEGNDLK